MGLRRTSLLNSMPHGVVTASSLSPSGTSWERSTRTTRALSSPRWTLPPTSLRRSRSRASPPSNSSRRARTRSLTTTETELLRDSAISWKSLLKTSPRTSCKNIGTLGGYYNQDLHASATLHLQQLFTNRL